MVSPPEKLPDELHFNALELLTPDERRLLVRYHVGEDLIQSREALCKELGIPMNALRVRVHLLRRKVGRMAAQLIDDTPALPAEKPSAAPVSTHPAERQAPPLEHLRHLLETRFPLLYAQVLEPTLADLREEHSAALAEGQSWKACCILLGGYGSLAAAAVRQLGYSLLGRIASLWHARSPK